MVNYIRLELLESTKIILMPAVPKASLACTGWDFSGEKIQIICPESSSIVIVRRESHVSVDREKE